MEIAMLLLLLQTSNEKNQVVSLINSGLGKWYRIKIDCHKQLVLEDYSMLWSFYYFLSSYCQVSFLTLWGLKSPKLNLIKWAVLHFLQIHYISLENYKASDGNFSPTSPQNLFIVPKTINTIQCWSNISFETHLSRLLYDFLLGSIK